MLKPQPEPARSRGLFDKHITLVDLAPNTGVSRYLKLGLLKELNAQGYGYDHVYIAIPGVKRAFASFFAVRSIAEVVRLVLDLGAILRFVLIYLTALTKSHSSFITILLGVEYREVAIGDCVLSAYFRSNRTKVIPQKSLQLFFYFVLSLMMIAGVIRDMSRKANKTSTEFLFCFETTGLEEAIRRNFVSRSGSEIRYSPFHKGFRVYSGFDGVALRRALGFRANFYEQASSADLDVGKRTIEGLINRTIKYEYMKSSDVDMSQQIGIEPFDEKATVVVFLSTLSDAQYLYGVGPYPTLPEFHERIIEFALGRGFNVLVKPHPTMLKDKDYSKKDRAYYADLCARWQAHDYGTNIRRSQKNHRLYFLGERIPIKEIENKCPGFLCVTQHGSIAAESAALGLFTLVGSNSQYFENDRFVHILHDAEELSQAFSTWSQFEGLDEEQRRSLYKYIYLNNVFSAPLYGNMIFERLTSKDQDSSMIEDWLADFLIQTETAEDQLLHEAHRFVSGLNNNFVDQIKLDG